MQHCSLVHNGMAALPSCNMQLAKSDLLIIGEASYITFNLQQSELLFKVIAGRVEKRSVIISTNLKFSE